MSDLGPYRSANPDIFGGPDEPPLTPGFVPPPGAPQSAVEDVPYATEAYANDANAVSARGVYPDAPDSAGRFATDYVAPVAANAKGRYPAAVQHAGAPAVGTRYPHHQYAPADYPAGNYPAVQYVAGQYTTNPNNAYSAAGIANSAAESNLPDDAGNAYHADRAYTVNARAHGVHTPYGIDTPYQTGYGNVGANQASGLGLGALITGILGLGIIPLILGIIGIRRAKTSGSPGYGMSLAGLILGVLSTVGWLAVFFGITAVFNSPIAQTAVVQQLTQFNVGECAYQTIDGNFDPIACDSSHSAEVVGVNVLPVGAFPGASSLQVQAQQFCQDAFANYVGIPAADSGLGLEFVVPTPVQWNLGNRQLVCWATNGGVPLPAGSISGARQ